MAIWDEPIPCSLKCAVLIVCGSLVGCISPPPVVSGDADAAVQTVQAFGGLDKVHLLGVLELHWTDDDGPHLESGDLEVWIKGRTHVSARVTRFSEIYLWTGRTPEGDFTFDRTSEPTSLTTTQTNEGIPSMLSVGTLRRLLGIDGVPCDAVVTSVDDAVRVTYDRPDGSHETMVLNAPGNRVTLVTIVTAEGHKVTAEHRDHDDGPRVTGRAFARYVDVRSDGELARVLVAEVQTPAVLPASVFDVERLKVALRPDVVRSGPQP